MDDKWKALEKYNLWGGNTYQLGLERKSYTDKIGNFVGNNLVKVLIGQRRSAKVIFSGKLLQVLSRNEE